MIKNEKTTSKFLFIYYIESLKMLLYALIFAHPLQSKSHPIIMGVR